MVESTSPPGPGGWRKRIRPGSFLAWLTIADALSYAFLVQGMRNVVGQDPGRLRFTYGVTWIFCLLVSALMAAFCRFAQPPRPEGEPRPRPDGWFLAAWAAGLALAGVASAIHWAAIGYVALPHVPVGNLIFFPSVLAAMMGFQFLDVFGSGAAPAEIRRRRLSPGLLIGVVAYLALLNGLAAATGPVGARARSYQERYMANDGQAKTCRRMKGELEPEIDRYRESVARLGQLADHYASLAAKYDRARARPWEDVPPDPPPPP